MYVGEGEEFDLNEEDQKLNHPHWVQDKDEEGFWDDILAYLHIWESCLRLEQRVIRFNERPGDSS